MAGRRLRLMVPWWARIGAKVALARLPIPYAFWKRMRLFEHGTMEQPSRALGTFLEHARSAAKLNPGPSMPPMLNAGTDFNVLEVGPGDSLFTAAIASSLGASRTWLVDAGPFATSDLGAYGRLADFLERQGYARPFGSRPGNVDDMLRACGGSYLTSGVASLASLASESIDFCFSNAVLEHIPKSDFAALAAETMRVLKPGGVCVHRVDLKDHLGGGLHNLRFSESAWEGALLSGSGFYTNRIRFGEMIAMFQRAGFEYALPRVIRWDRLPLSRSKLDAAFRHVPDDDLLVSDFDIVLTRAKVTS